MLSQGAASVEAYPAQSHPALIAYVCVGCGEVAAAKSTYKCKAYDSVVAIGNVRIRENDIPHAIGVEPVWFGLV